MDVIFYFSILLIIQVIVWLIGGCIRLCVFGNPFLLTPRNVFLNLCVGTIAIVTGYSIYTTKGKTINWLFLLIALMYKFSDRKKIFVVGNDSDKLSKLVFLSLSFIWTLAMFLYYYYRNGEPMFFRPIEVDNYFTSQLSQFLNKGFENTMFFANIYDNMDNSVLLSPYHYCETWLSSIIYAIFNINALFSYSVILPVFLLSVMVWGYFSLVQDKQISIFFLCLLLMSFLFISDLGLQMKPLFGENFIYILRGNNLMIQSKILFISVFVLLGVLFLFEKDYLALFYSQLLLFPISITIVPAVGGLLGAALVFDYFKNRVFRLEYIFPFGVVIVLYLYYVYNGMSASISLTENNPIPFVKMRMLVTTPLAYVVRYSLWIVLLFFLNTKKCLLFLNKYSFYIVIFVVVTVSFRVFLAGKNSDSVQFVSLANTVYLSVLLPAAVLYLVLYSDSSLSLLYNRLNRYFPIKLLYIYIFLIAVQGVCSVDYVMRRNVYPISEKRMIYEKKVIDSLNFHHITNVGIYNNGSGNSHGNNLVEFYGIYGTYLDAYKNNITYWQLNIRDIKEKGLVPYLYELSSVNDNDFFRMQFCLSKQIEYMIVYKNASPSKEFLANWNLIAFDSTTGERFFKLKEL